jgi:hypothetical protein
MLDIRPLTLVFRIRLAILIIVMRIGTATTPLMTAVYTNALIASILEKFISRFIHYGGRPINLVHIRE